MNEKDFIYKYLERHYTIETNNFEMVVKEINGCYLYTVDNFLRDHLWPVFTNNEIVARVFDNWYENKRIEYTERAMFGN